MGRRASDHATGLLADRMDSAGHFVDCYDGRLENGNPTAPNEDEGVRRAKIDRELATPLETPLCHRPLSNGTRKSGGIR
jgi:hypothetical protein